MGSQTENDAPLENWESPPPDNSPDELVLWKITGCESSTRESATVVYVFTPSQMSIPIPLSAINKASGKEYHYCRIAKIEQIDRINTGSGNDGMPGSAYGTIDQATMDNSIPEWLADTLALGMMENKKLRAGNDELRDELRSLKVAWDAAFPELPLDHQGVAIQWGERKDRRILQFIDEMGGRFRKRLRRIVEEHGSGKLMVSLYWNGSPPKGFRSSEHIFATGEDWTIGLSEQVKDDPD